MLLTASGVVFATPGTVSAISKRSQQLSAGGTATASGHASVPSRILPPGGLTDFGLWDADQPDSAMSRDVSHMVATDALPKRGWLAATAPARYAPDGVTPLWEEAVYASLGIKWDAMAPDQSEAFHQVQLESVTLENRLSWDATSWEGRACYTAQAESTGTSVFPSDEAAFSGMYSGKITYEGGVPDTSFGYTIRPVIPIGFAPCRGGESINGSVSLKMDRNTWWTAGLTFYNSNYEQLPLSGPTWYYNNLQQHPGGGAWDTSYVYWNNAPADAAWVAVTPYISIHQDGTTATPVVAQVGEVSYCDMHRIWTTPYELANVPDAYESPKKLTLDIKANRVNLVNNPSFDEDLSGWGASGWDWSGSAPYPVSWDSVTGREKAGSLKFFVSKDVGTYPSLAAAVGTGLLTAWSLTNVGGFGWQTNTRYTSSVYVKLGPDCPNVTLNPTYTPIDGVLSTDDALANHPELVEGDWIRLWATFNTSRADNGLVGLQLSINSQDVITAGKDAYFWVDDVLCEEGDRAQPFFYGNSPGSDYLWAGSKNMSSSHYYRGYRSNRYRLKDIAEAAVPHGTQVEIRYAQPPQ